MHIKNIHLLSASSPACTIYDTFGSFSDKVFIQPSSGCIVFVLWLIHSDRNVSLGNIEQCDSSWIVNLEVSLTTKVLA